MHPELFEVPFLHVTVKSWGLMVVVGFLAAMWIMRKLMKRCEQNPDWISNAALYSLIAGIAGARLFFVLHHPSYFKDNPLSVFAVWQGGVEFLGGVIAALCFLGVYLVRNKLSVRLYLDVLAIGLMAGLGFGRIGCFFSGCCFGKPADVPWAVRFPYDSTPYHYQVRPQPERNRFQPLLQLPESYWNTGEGERYLKPFDDLTDQQKQQVTEGPYRCLPIHPTQIYSSINAFLLAIILYAIWRRWGRIKPGLVSALMLTLYGATRFWMETLRGDNPFERAWWAVYKGGTISQNLGIYLVVAGLLLAAGVLWKSRPLPEPPVKKNTKSKP